MSGRWKQKWRHKYWRWWKLILYLMSPKLTFHLLNQAKISSWVKSETIIAMVMALGNYKIKPRKFGQKTTCFPGRYSKIQMSPVVHNWQSGIIVNYPSCPTEVTSYPKHMFQRNICGDWRNFDTEWDLLSTYVVWLRWFAMLTRLCLHHVTEMLTITQCRHNRYNDHNFHDSDHIYCDLLWEYNLVYHLPTNPTTPQPSQ